VSNTWLVSTESEERTRMLPTVQLCLETTSAFILIASMAAVLARTKRQNATAVASSRLAVRLPH